MEVFMIKIDDYKIKIKELKRLLTEAGYSL